MLSNSLYPSFQTPFHFSFLSKRNYLLNSVILDVLFPKFQNYPLYFSADLLADNDNYFSNEVIINDLKFDKELNKNTDFNENLEIRKLFDKYFLQNDSEKNLVKFNSISSFSYDFDCMKATIPFCCFPCYIPIPFSALRENDNIFESIDNVNIYFKHVSYFPLLNTKTHSKNMLSQNKKNSQNIVESLDLFTSSSAVYKTSSAFSDSSSDPFRESRTNLDTSNTIEKNGNG
jgi:hypothetical protein